MCNICIYLFQKWGFCSPRIISCDRQFYSSLLYKFKPLVSLAYPFLVAGVSKEIGVLIVFNSDSTLVVPEEIWQLVGKIAHSQSLSLRGAFLKCPCLSSTWIICSIKLSSKDYYCLTPSIDVMHKVLVIINNFADFLPKGFSNSGNTTDWTGTFCMQSIRHWAMVFLILLVIIFLLAIPKIAEE